MLFSSLLFIFCFLPITLFLYFIMPRGKKNVWKNTVLFVVSIIFYAWGEPTYILLLVAQSSVSFIIGRIYPAFSENACLRARAFAR